MNILYIDHYAGSPELGMEYRPYYLAKEWVRAGHSVTIVGASFAHTRQKNPGVQDSITHEDIDGIHYVWIKTPAYKGNGGGRVVNMLAFVVGLFRHLPTFTKTWHPNVVIASSTYPLDFYPARKIAHRHKARLVFELHDLWPLSPMELGHMSRFNPFIAVMQIAEDAWCRQCDVAVSILPHADLHLCTRGLSPEKFVHVPNGIDLAEWTETAVPLPREHQEFLDKKRGQGRFLVGYTGAHGVANALDALIDAAGHLRDHPIDLVLVGTGPERERLIAKALALRLENVYFLNSIPKAAIPTWLRQMDSFYLGFQRSPLYHYGVSPNKLFDYLMAEKPVVYATNSSNDSVEEADCGISVKAEDPRAIADGILVLLQTSPEHRLAMGHRGREYILAKHTYPVLAARFLAVLKPDDCLTS
jgi:glycosyltransferase involved in cell wall biosynthesis